MTLAETFEKKIKDHELPQPIPKWALRTRKFIIWSVFILVCLISVISISVFIWFLLDPNGFFEQTGEATPLNMALDILPVIWGALSLVAAAIAVAVFIKLPRGYRYKTPLTLGAVVLGLILAGSSACALGVAEQVERSANKLPVYSRLSKPRLLKFMRPEQGMIIGNVKNIDEGEMILEDPVGNVWRTDIFHVGQKSLESGAKPGKCIKLKGVADQRTKFFDASSTSPCPRGAEKIH